MRSIAIVYVLGALLAGAAHAGICEDAFAKVTSLYDHQRVALAEAHRGGFSIRVFTKEVAGLVRTVVLAGRAEIADDAHGNAGYQLRTAFPELARTRRTDDVDAVVEFPLRSEDARIKAMTTELERRMGELTQGGRGMTLSTRYITKDSLLHRAFTATSGERIRAHRDHPRASVPPPAEQVTYDLEAGYQPSPSAQLVRILPRFLLGASFLKNVLLGSALGLFAAIPAQAVFGHHPSPWLFAWAGGVMVAHIGLDYALRGLASRGSGLRDQNQFLVNGLEQVLAQDADVSEMLILTEDRRTVSLARDLARAGFTETLTAPRKP